MDMKLPFLGDGVETAVVVSILVKVGDTVAVDQNIFELETDKAVAPIPATAAGKVEAILVKEGDKVKAGMPVISLSGGSEAPAAAPQAAAPVTPVAASAQVTPQTTSAAQTAPVSYSPSTYTYVSGSGSHAPTSPSIEMAAARFGIDLTRVPGTGSGGRITDADVKTYITMLQGHFFAAKPEAAAEAAPAKKPVAPTIDFAKFGPVRKVALTSLRGKIADKMQTSWNTIPHVTQFATADITQLMELRKIYKPKFEKKEANLTLTGFALKAVVQALKEFPAFNASLDESTNEMVYKDYYHIGIAVDTENGLIVPVIRDVDKKSVLELSLELGEIAKKARDRKLTLENLQGGTFTISNLGGLGAGAFTPIVNHPEVAILGLSAGQKVPTYDEKGNIVPKLTMPLSVSYDHRVIDGADGARFVKSIVTAFETFSEALLKEK